MGGAIMVDRRWFDAAQKQVKQQVETSEDAHPERLIGYDALLRQLAGLPAAVSPIPDVFRISSAAAFDLREMVDGS
jgi:hypothetical protein